MTKSTKKAGLVVKSSVKSGGVNLNHSRPVLATAAIPSAKKAGLAVKSSIKSGGVNLNHTLALLAA